MDITPRHIHFEDEEHPLGIIANLAAQINTERQYGFPDYGPQMPRSYRTPTGATHTRFGPERSERGSLRGSRTSGQNGSSEVGADLVTNCVLGEPNLSLLPYPKPALTNLGDSMGYGLRTHVRIYCKGAKICRLFWRNPNNAAHITGGPYVMHYCLIQMNKDKNISDAISGEPNTGYSGLSIFEKFFRDYSQSNDTWRTFEDEETWPQTLQADWKMYKNCNNINPNNGMFKLLMRKRFMLECPTSFSQQNLAGRTRTGAREVRMYKKLPHLVTWEDKANATPERPIYELWWGYPTSPAQHINVAGGTEGAYNHYFTCATNTMYFKDVGHA